MYDWAGSNFIKLCTWWYLLLVIIERRYILVSQLMPTYPGLQTQEYRLRSSLHNPPFRHGELSHSLKSKTKKVEKEISYKNMIASFKNAGSGFWLIWPENVDQNFKYPFCYTMLTLAESVLQAKKKDSASLFKKGRIFKPLPIFFIQTIGQFGW